MSGISLLATSNAHPSFSDYNQNCRSVLFGQLKQKFSFTNSFSTGSLLTTDGSSGSIADCDNNGLKVIVDGYFVETLGGEKTSAEWFLGEYVKYGDELFPKLNGSFNILIVNSKNESIKIVSDRFGTRPLFYYQSSDVFALCPFAQGIIKSGIVDKKLNLAMVANQLSYSRVWVGDETFFKEVYSFPSCSVASWVYGQKVEWSVYIPSSTEKVPKKNGSVSELADIFRSVLVDYNKLENVGLSLSGGLDSRILLAAGFEGNTFTWGYEESNSDISLAHESAKVNGNSWKFINLKPEQFLDVDQSGDIFREGLDMCVQAYTLQCYEEVHSLGIRGLMTGLALDFTMAGSYLPVSVNDRQGALDLIKNKSEVFSALERDKLITSEIIKSEVLSLSQKMEQSVTIEENSSYGEKVQNFFMESRVRRCIFQRQQWQRAYVEDYIPTFDNRITDYLDRYNLEDLAGHQLFKEVLMELSPSLSELKYQGTMLPVTAPLDLWEKGVEIELEREQLYRRIFSETNGQVYIPYDRYYSNFDEWMRTNKSWITYIDEMLLSNETRISEFVNLDVISEWVGLQKSGREPMFGKIIQLLSLEKTLRTHF